jgi:elongation factor Ts
MTQVTAKQIQELRHRTGVSIGKCKTALVEANGVMDDAIENLRKVGAASAVKKAARETKEGAIIAASSEKHIAIAEANAETDFVVNNERFKLFHKEVCDEILLKKPASLDEFLSMAYSKDESKTLNQVREETIAVLGENIKISRILVLTRDENTSWGLYSHMNGKIFCAVEISGDANQETLAKEIAMQVAAEAPEYLERDEIPEAVLTKEREIASEQIPKNKPENILGKILEGKINSFCDQICLLKQKFIKDPSQTIEQLVAAKSKEISKELKVVQFIRWQIGG